MTSETFLLRQSFIEILWLFYYSKHLTPIFAVYNPNVNVFTTLNRKKDNKHTECFSRTKYVYRCMLEAHPLKEKQTQNFQLDTSFAQKHITHWNDSRVVFMYLHLHAHYAWKYSSILYMIIPISLSSLYSLYYSTFSQWENI